MREKSRILITCALIMLLSACREVYQPPATNKSYSYLVVEGIINPDSTTVTLSRTRNLNDTISFIPELNAGISIESTNGSRYALNQKGNGVYSISGLALNLNDKYRLNIVTAANSLYQSDYVLLKRTPPIDSLPWKHEDGVTIFLNAHDPSNNTRYYRWEFEETWEYNSYYDSHLGYSNGQVYFRDSAHLLSKCWGFERSTEILLGASDQLSQDQIQFAPLANIPEGSIKLNIQYSILVKQYGLSKEAYAFWQLLKRNTNQVGSIFDAQPSELIGNVHCLTKPDETVIGYVSAATTETKRIFISRGELSSWTHHEDDQLCTARVILADDSIPIYLRDTSLAPAYYSGGSLAIAKNICVDCTVRGGSTKKPSFWP